MDLDTKSLIQLLSQYIYSKNKCKDYEERLLRIREELGTIKGNNISIVPRSQGGVNDGVASFVYRVNEIEEQIAISRDSAAIKLLDVMSVLDLLESGSIGKRILEYKYIDNLKIYQIVDKIKYSRTSCYDYIDLAHRKLLGFAEVKEMIRATKKQGQKK
jgi:Protein of unknown function (DUF1492).